MEVLIIAFVIWLIQTVLDKASSKKDEQWLEDSEWTDDEKRDRSAEGLEARMAQYKAHQEKKNISATTPNAEPVQKTPPEDLIAPKVSVATKADSLGQLSDKEISKLAQRMNQRQQSEVEVEVKTKKKHKVKLNLRQAFLHKVILEKPKALQ